MITIQESIPATAKTRLALRVFALLLASFFGLFVGMVLSGKHDLASTSSIALGFLIPLALLMTARDLKQSLPIQNVIAIVVLIVFITGLLEIANAMSANPSGKDVSHNVLGLPVFHLFRWRVPLLWAVNFLNSRSVARLLLSRWRDFRNYGFLSLGATAVLTALSNFSIDYFGGIGPWTAFFIYATIAAILFVAATPWLIDKKSRPTPAPGYFPLLVWVMLLGFLFGLCDVVS